MMLIASISHIPVETQALERYRRSMHTCPPLEIGSVSLKSMDKIPLKVPKLATILTLIWLGSFYPCLDITTKTRSDQSSLNFHRSFDEPRSILHLSTRSRLSIYNISGQATGQHTALTVDSNNKSHLVLDNTATYGTGSAPNLNTLPMETQRRFVNQRRWLPRRVLHVAAVRPDGKVCVAYQDRTV